MAGSSYTESSVKTYVDNRFNAATAYADAARTTLNTFLTDLSSAIQGFSGTPVDFTGADIPAAYTPGAIVNTTQAFLAVPNFPNAPVLAAIPAKPGTVADFTEVVVDADTTDAAKAAMTGLLSNGKLLDAVSEQAMYDRAVNRSELENERLEDNLMNLWSSRGFEVPSDVLLAQVVGAQKEQSRNALEVNAEILAKSGELAMQSAGAVVQAAGVWLQHIDSVNQRALQLKISNVENAIKAFQIEAQMVISNAQNMISLYDNQIRAALGVVSANIQNNTVQVSTQTEVEKLKLAGNDNAIKAAGMKRDLIIKQAETQLREAANLLNIQLDSMKAGAQVNAQIVASALSSYSSNISYGFSGGWNDNYSTDNTKAIVSESIIHNRAE